jgi:NADH-quinone oxidoreductase subunit M
VGEVLTMTGAYGVSTTTALIAATGVIFSAVYALTLYRRVVFGELVNPKLAGITDLDWREIVTFSPLIISALALGIYPHFVTDVTQASAQHLVDLWRAGAGG